MLKNLFPITTEEVSNLPFFITSVGASENQEHVFRTEGYTSYHWIFTVSGEGRLEIDGNEYTIGENMGFFFYPGIPHRYYTSIEPWETAWVTFDGYALPRLLETMRIGQSEVFEIFDAPMIASLHSEIYNAALKDSPSIRFESSYLTYKFLLALKSYTNICGRVNQPVNMKRLQPLLSFIDENYMKSISLEEMAEVLDITPQHLCRLFKQSINIRPFEYLTKCRLKKAKEMLVGKENPSLVEVASNVGYNDISYFCAKFKEHEGMTPVQFKKMHKEL